MKTQLAVLAAAMAASAVWSADLPKEGSYDMTACVSGVTKDIVFGKDYLVTSIEQSGTTLSAAPGGMLDKGVFHCLGQRTTFAGKVNLAMYCEAAFADGKIFSSFVTAPDNTIVRDVLAGTGKYEGMVSSGKVFPIGPFPVQQPGMFQNCNRQTGTYRMK